MGKATTEKLELISKSFQEALEKQFPHIKNISTSGKASPKESAAEITKIFTNTLMKITYKHLGRRAPKNKDLTDPTTRMRKNLAKIETWDAFRKEIINTIPQGENALKEFMATNDSQTTLAWLKENNAAIPTSYGPYGVKKGQAFSTEPGSSKQGRTASSQNKDPSNTRGTYTTL